MKVDLAWEQRQTIKELLGQEVRDIQAGEHSYGTAEHNADEIAHLESIIEMMEDD